MNNFDKPPLTEGDLQKFIDLNIGENIHLDYKRTDALLNSKWKPELAKDVSAFANSDGGLLIFGIEEDTNHDPLRVDEGMLRGKVTKEMIEQVVGSGISPRVHGILISEILLSNGNSAFAVVIPKSFTPHQEKHGFRYYKRFNFESVPLHDFEIEDLRRREEKFRSLVRVSVQIEQRFLVVLKIANPDNFVAGNVGLTFEPPIPWRNGTPKAIRDGIKYLAPQQEITFTLDSTHEILNPEKGYPGIFEVRAKYSHSLLGRDVEETFFVDLASWAGAKAPLSELERFSDKLIEAIEKVTAELKEIKGSLDEVKRISSPTGLALSASALNDIKLAASGSSESSKLDPELRDFGPYAMQEILDVQHHVANQIWCFFRFPEADKTLDTLFPDNPELVKKIRDKFYLSGRVL